MMLPNISRVHLLGFLQQGKVLYRKDVNQSLECLEYKHYVQRIIAIAAAIRAVPLFAIDGWQG